MNLAIWLERTAAVSGERPALHLGETCIADYATFHARAASLAAALVARGVRPGDRVAIFAKNCPDYLIVFFGVWMAGAAVVPINAKLHPREAAYIAEHSGAVLGFVSSDLGEALALAVEVPLIELGDRVFDGMTCGAGRDCVARAPEDLCWLFYTLTMQGEQT